MAVELQGLNRYSGGELITRIQRTKCDWLARVKGEIENRCCASSECSSVASGAVSRLPWADGADPRLSVRNLADPC